MVASACLQMIGSSGMDTFSTGRTFIREATTSATSQTRTLTVVPDTSGRARSVVGASPSLASLDLGQSGVHPLFECLTANQLLKDMPSSSSLAHA